MEALGGVLLLALLVGFLALLAVPFVLVVLLIAGVIKISLFLVLLPLRLFGWLFGLGVTLTVFLLKGFVVTGALALLVLLGLLPLLPLILLGGLIYLLVRTSRRGAAPPVGA
jgi:hypothetical protein